MNQQGAALVIGLVLLTSISLVALTAATGTVFQQRMAASSEQHSRLLAWAGLADQRARNWLLSRSALQRDAGCATAGLLPAHIHRPSDLPASPEFEAQSWWQTRANSSNLNQETLEPLEITASTIESHWLISEIHCQQQPPLDLAWYRILARSQASGSGQVRVTESIIARPWGQSVAPDEYPSVGHSGPFCAQFATNIPCGRVAWRQLR